MCCRPGHLEDEPIPEEKGEPIPARMALIRMLVVLVLVLTGCNPYADLFPARPAAT